MTVAVSQIAVGSLYQKLFDFLGENTMQKADE